MTKTPKCAKIISGFGEKIIKGEKMRRLYKLMALFLVASLVSGCAYVKDNASSSEGSFEDGSKNDSFLGGILAGNDEKDGSGADSEGESELKYDVKMTASIKAINEKIEVEVIEGDYGASGIYWVLTNENTDFTAKDGSVISKADLKVGDVIEIGYGGQVMMSYPPQIVAVKIAVK